MKESLEVGQWISYPMGHNLEHPKIYKANNIPFTTPCGLFFYLQNVLHKVHHGQISISHKCYLEIHNVESADQPPCVCVVTTCLSFVGIMIKIL